MRRLRKTSIDERQLDKQSIYDRLRNEDCKGCPLYETAQHVCLIGRGNLDADIFIIGEAPGVREDDIGKPFAGRSGELLDDVLLELGLSRSEVYISNVVHCRPPDNRTPTPKEINSCVKYLERELNLVKPNIIIPVGNVALKAMIGTTGILRYRGHIYDYEGKGFEAKIIPTVHPAFVLRSPGHMDEFVEDMSKAVDMLGGNITESKCDFDIITKVSGVLSLCQDLKRAKSFSFDVETNTLDWWSDEGIVTTMGISYDGKKGFVIPLEHSEAVFSDDQIYDIWVAISNILGNKNITKIGQNIKFDLHWAKEYGCKIRMPIHDLLFVSYLLNENVLHDLDTLSLKYTNFGMYWKEVNRLGLKKGNSYNIPLEKLAPYQATDAVATYYIFQRLYDELSKEPKLVRDYDLIMRPAIMSLLDAEYRGMLIDTKRLGKLITRFSDETDRIIKRLNRFKAVKKFDKIMAEEKGKKWKGVNFNSSSQMGRLIFSNDGFGYDIIKETETGNASSKEEVLIELINMKSKFALSLLELRKIRKLDSTYVTGLLKHIATDNAVHPNFRISGTVTGRLSCTKPNLQNIPRTEPSEYDSPMKSEVKTVYIPRKGYVFISIDASQAELRWMTHFSGEKNMMRWFKEGKDVHRYVAIVMLETTEEDFSQLDPKVQKAHRKRAKTVDFGTIYDVGKYTLAENLSSPREGIFYTPDQAQAFLNRFFELFPAIKDFMDEMRAKAKRDGYVETAFGRKRRLPEVYSDDKKVRAEALRQAINSPIQGSAGEMTIFGMNYLMGHIDGKRKVPKHCYLVNQVHDQIIIEVPESEYIDIGNSIIEVVNNLPFEEYFEFTPRVPMPFDLEYSDTSWAELKKLKL